MSDIKFLKEMKLHLSNRDLEIVETMIDDWIDELEKESIDCICDHCAEIMTCAEYHMFEGKCETCYESIAMEEEE